MSDSFQPSFPEPKPANPLRDSDLPAAHLTYAFFALGLLTGVFAVIGVIMAYVKRGDARGTFLASHYSWLIGLFWWTLFWVVVMFVLVFVGLLTFGLGFFLLWPLGIGVWIWGIYRVIKGWLRLIDQRAVA